MSKLNLIKAKLAQILLSLSTIKTDKAILEYDGEELAVDVEVYVTDENGERKLAEDGEYTTEDGTIITVKDGKVDTIVEVVEEPTEEEPVAEEELEEEQPTEEEKVDELAELKAQVDELTAMVEKILEKIGDDATKVDERLSKIEKMSMAKPIQQEIEVARTKKTTILNDKQKNRISELNKDWRAV